MSRIFSCFPPEAENFSSLSGRETSLVNRNLTMKSEFEFKPDRLLIGLLAGFRVISNDRLQWDRLSWRLRVRPV